MTMIENTNIIPVRIGCQTLSDGADNLWLEIGNQLIIIGTIDQNEIPSIKKSPNGVDQRIQTPTEKSKLRKCHSLKPIPTSDIPIVTIS